jgi:hypothetical protein
MRHQVKNSITRPDFFQSNDSQSTAAGQLTTGIWLFSHMMSGRFVLGKAQGLLCVELYGKQANRGDVRGTIRSMSGFTAAAVQQSKGLS